MAPWNIAFSIFALEARPIETWLPALDKMFGGQFVQDLEHKAEGRRRYTNYVFGIEVNCSFEEQWAEGAVYCINGNNHPSFRFDTLEEVDLGFHASALLSSVGFTRIMSFEEFRDESKRRSQSRPQNL